MARILTLTLALLLATTELILTDAEAFDYDWQQSTLWGEVDGETYVSTWYDSTTKTAYSYHWYYVENNQIAKVKAYPVSEATFTWPGDFAEAIPPSISLFVLGNSSQSYDHTHSHWMGDKEKGGGSVSASSNMRGRHTAKEGIDAVKWWSGAACSTNFEIK